MSVAALALPPHSAASEQAVLGALMLEPKAWPLVAPILGPKDFYRPDHQLLFETIARLSGKGQVADVVTVGAALEQRGDLDAVGGHAHLMRLVRETATAATVEHYAHLVRERSMLRQLGEFARLLESAALGGDGESAEVIAARASAQLSAIQSQATSGGGLVKISDLTQRLIDDLDARREGKRGLPIGLADFDEITGGLEPGELTIIAGRPGLGKTALLCTAAANASKDGWVGIFSAEMPALQIGRRLLALLGGPAQDRLRRPERMTDDDWARVTHAIGRLAERHIAIDDKQLPSIEHVRAECLGYKARWGMGLVMIDYAQLVQGQGKNRYEQLREVAYGAKALAKELACPVVMLAQLNRGVEQRAERRPMLSDLRDSGAIEEAADIVGLLYREGYYNPDFAMPQVVECAIEKHRNGERGQCLWHFAGEFSRMTALESEGRHEYRQLIRGRSES